MEQGSTSTHPENMFSIDTGFQMDRTDGLTFNHDVLLKDVLKQVYDFILRKPDIDKLVFHIDIWNDTTGSESDCIHPLFRSLGLCHNKHNRPILLIKDVHMSNSIFSELKWHDLTVLLNKFLSTIGRYVTERSYNHYENYTDNPVIYMNRECDPLKELFDEFSF